MVLDTMWGNMFRDRKKGKESGIDILRAVPIFEDLSDSELRAIEQKVYVRRYVEGETIFKEGDPSLGVYIVKQGTVTVMRQVPQGPPMVLATLTVGDFFGEIGLVDDAPRSATVVATQAAEAIGFFKPDLDALVRHKPDIGVKIYLGVAKTLSARLRRTSEDLYQQSLERQHGARPADGG